MKAGKAQILQRSGLVGMALVLACIVILREGIVDFMIPLAVATGITNGAYWFVNHIETFDRSNNGSRASFISYRHAVQGISKLAVPAVGWAAFGLLANKDSAYTAIFIISMMSLLAAWYIDETAEAKTAHKGFAHATQEFNRSQYFKLMLLNGFLYGLSLRSALATVLLPFLIFQAVGKESSLSSIQTVIELLALSATFYFAAHKKNTDYITRLMVLGASAALVVLIALYAELSVGSYGIFVISYVVALKATNIAIGTLSTNYAEYVVKEYQTYKVAFVSIREIFALAGFIAGYVFIYIYDDLTLASLRPLLLIMMFATLSSFMLSVKLWRFVRAYEP